SPPSGRLHTPDGDAVVCNWSARGRWRCPKRQIGWWCRVAHSHESRLRRSLGPLATRVGYDPGLESETFHQHREPGPYLADSSTGRQYRGPFRRRTDLEKV